MTIPRDREAMAEAEKIADIIWDLPGGVDIRGKGVRLIAKALLEFAEEESIERRRFEGEWQEMGKLYRTAMETNQKQAKSHMALRKEIEILKSANEFLSKAVDANIQKARNSALNEAANVARASAVYYSKNTKRKDGTFNTTVASAAQTSHDICQEILALLPTGVKDV